MYKLFYVFAVVFTFISCNYTSGSGNIITENRSVDNFTGISTSSSIDVEVSIGEKNDVRIEADDNILPFVKTTVNDGVLKIGYKNNTSLNNAHVKVFVTIPYLKYIHTSSSANINVLGIIKHDGKIRFEASSSSEIKAAVDAPEVSADASSSSTINLSGKTQKCDVEVSSSADINAQNLLSENTHAKANSSGTANVHASVSLDAKASSSGDINYRGNPTLNKSVSSSGSVEKKD